MLFYKLFLDRLRIFERCRKKVENVGDLLTKLPRTEVVVPNTTYKVFVIGRRVLNYCGGFGVEG